jgi:hypothetical protein
MRAIMISILVILFSSFCFIEDEEVKNYTLNSETNEGNVICLNDSLRIITNSNDWLQTYNNVGQVMNVAPYTLVHPVSNDWWWDSIYPGAWLSCISNAKHLSVNSGVNDIMKFEFKFDVCLADTLNLNVKFYRDNFCNIYIDGVQIFSDPTFTANSINLNVGDVITYSFPVSAQSTHTLTYEVIEYNVPGYPGNGWGGKMSGWLHSKTGKNSLVQKNSICANYNCVSKINNYEKTNAIIYPNPCSSDLFVQIENMEETDFKILNNVGTILQKGKVEKNNSIDISKLMPGIYMLQLISNNRQQFLKFQKTF